MKIKIISVGKLKEDYFVQAAAEYEKRLGRFCKVESICLPDKAIEDKPSAATCEKIKNAEGEAILRCIDKGDFVFALCVEGKMLSSEALAQKTEDVFLTHSTAVFVIGGALGLSEKVKARANMRLSISPMTFPHRLARIIIEEQIYRAFKINANEEYHK